MCIACILGMKLVSRNYDVIFVKGGNKKLVLVGKAARKGE